MSSVITDAEFWTHIRLRNSSSDCIFRSMLKLLHARQARLAGPTWPDVLGNGAANARCACCTDVSRSQSAAFPGTTTTALQPTSSQSLVNLTTGVPVCSSSCHVNNNVSNENDMGMCDLSRPQSHLGAGSRQMSSTLAQEEFVLFEEGVVASEEVSATPAGSGEVMKRQAIREQRAQELIACRDDASIDAQHALLSFPHCPPRRVAPITIRVVQQVMLFAVPIYALRYNIPAMSMSWNCSCLIRYASKDLVVFGASPAAVQRNTMGGSSEAYRQVVSLPMGGRGVVVGNNFIAILSDANEVWVKGKMDVAHRPSHAMRQDSAPRRGRGTEEGGSRQNGVLSATSSRAGIVVNNCEANNNKENHPRSSTTTSYKNSNNTDKDRVNSKYESYKDCFANSCDAETKSFARIADRVLMLTGHGDRLACIVDGFGVCPLSLLSTPIQFIMPPRRVRFMDLGYGEDYFMISVESVLYKTTASKRAVGTPRRVMSMSRGTVSRVSSGSGFALIIDQNGLLITIGRNKSGQLGMGHCRDARRLPFRHMDLSHHFFVQVAAGDRHSLALTSSGVVYGAGSNEVGQLGMGEAQRTAHMFMPIALPCRCVGIAAGPACSMFACEDGTVWVCGANGSQQLGIESAHNCVYRPTAIPHLRDGVVSYVIEFGAYRAPRHPSPCEHPLQGALSSAAGMLRDSDGTTTRNNSDADTSNNAKDTSDALTNVQSCQPTLPNNAPVSQVLPSSDVVVRGSGSGDAMPTLPWANSTQLPLSNIPLHAVPRLSLQPLSELVLPTNTVNSAYLLPGGVETSTDISVPQMGYGLHEPLAGLDPAAALPVLSQGDSYTSAGVISPMVSIGCTVNATPMLMNIVGSAANACQQHPCILAQNKQNTTCMARPDTVTRVMPQTKTEKQHSDCCSVM